MMEAKKSGAGHRKYKLCRRILGNPIVEEDTYCREIKDGKPHGDGEVNGKGEREGFGVMVYASGNMYEGQWRAGMFCGQGTFREATGVSYVGQWGGSRFWGQGSVYTGQGTLRFASGCKYEGQFAEGNYHGQGTCHYASGDKYVGQWVDGLREGYGTWYSLSGDEYDGQAEMNHYTTAHLLGVVGPGGGRPSSEVAMGEGARWSADRRQAWRLFRCVTQHTQGVEVTGISLEEAAQIAERMGLPVPGAAPA